MRQYFILLIKKPRGTKKKTKKLLKKIARSLLNNDRPPPNVCIRISIFVFLMRFSVLFALAKSLGKYMVIYVYVICTYIHIVQ